MSPFIPFAVILASLVLCLAPRWFRWARARLSKPEAAAVEVARSLREEPQRWRRGGRHYVVHESGLKVWISNSAYGLHAEVPGEYGTIFERTDGFSGGNPSQRVVWQAFKVWRSKSPDREAARIRDLLQPRPVNVTTLRPSA